MIAILNCAAQSDDENAYTKGKSVISVGYGVVNIWSYFLKNALAYPENSYKVSSMGPFALTYDYGLSKHISAGIAIGYSVTNGKFDQFGYKFTEKLTGFTVLARSNYHFFIKGNKFDPYVGAGLGFFKFNYSNDSPGIVNTKVPGSFGYSAQLGTRYYFSELLGLHAELGYVGTGGSLGELGVSFKF